MTRTPRQHVLSQAFAGMVLLAFVFCGGPVYGQVDTRGAALDSDLSLVEIELIGLERRIAGLRAEVSGGSLTRSPRLTTERFNEARYAYLIEDYERCALIFFSLLQADDLKKDPRQPQAQWYLAECLYLDNNFIPAQDVYRTIVDVGAAHPFYGDSLLKLIEIYGRTGDVNQFNYYYFNFVRSSQDESPTSRRIRYEMGKTLFRQGKLPEAQAIFSSFPRGSTYTPQARYFSGTILVADGQEAFLQDQKELSRQKYQQAIAVFQEALTLPTSTREQEMVMDLCHLAIARLHYELGDISAAIAEYTAIESDSHYYGDALYEMVWANVEAATQETSTFERARKYDEALRAIEIFALAFPNDTREAALRLLSGHVRVRKQNFDGAIEKYEAAAGHFRDLKLTVDEIVQSGSEPMVYFNQLVGEDLVVAEATLVVPEAVQRQARSDERVAEAVRVSSDLYRQQDALKESSGLLDVLEDALFGSDTVGMIQTYRLHRQQLNSAEAAALLLRSRLVELEMFHLSTYLDSQGRSDLEQFIADKEEAEGATTGLTRLRNRSLERAEVFNMQAEAVETRAYHVEVLTNELLSQVQALNEYLSDSRGRGERTREEEAAIRPDLERERKLLTEARDQLKVIKQRLEPRVLTARLLNESSEGESELRSGARSSVGRLESRLEALRVRATGGQDFLSRLDVARRRLQALDRVAGQARGLMDKAEAREIDDVKKEVAFQRREVGQLSREGTEIGAGNRSISGRIGKMAFEKVAMFYEDMLARADMGVIDVYWQRKEETSREKRETAREKNKRLRALEEAFSSLLEATN